MFGWTRATLALVAVGTIMAFGACGSQGTAGDRTGTPAVTKTPVTTKTPAGSPTATASVSPTPTPGGDSTKVTPAPVSVPARDLVDRGYEVLDVLSSRDFVRLAGLVQPNKPVTFSPYAFVTADRIQLSVQQLRTLAPGDMFVWGAYDGRGNPIELSVADYFDKFVLNRDYAQAPIVSVDNLVRTGNTISNLDEVFPGAHFVEFHFPGGDTDWASLRLVFEDAGGQWMLVGVVGDRWTI